MEEFEKIDSNVKVLEEIEKELEALEGIPYQEKLEAFIMIANATIEELLVVFSQCKERNLKSLETIENISVVDKEVTTATIGAVMLIEDEVERVLEEE